MTGQVLAQVLPALVVASVLPPAKGTLTWRRFGVRLGRSVVEWLAMYFAIVLIMSDGPWPGMLDEVHPQQFWTTVTCVVCARRISDGRGEARCFVTAVALLATWQFARGVRNLLTLLSIGPTMDWMMTNGVYKHVFAGTTALIDAFHIAAISALMNVAWGRLGRIALVRERGAPSERPNKER